MGKKVHNVRHKAMPADVSVMLHNKKRLLNMMPALTSFSRATVARRIGRLMVSMPPFEGVTIKPPALPGVKILFDGPLSSTTKVNLMAGEEFDEHEEYCKGSNT
jgi:hypothetical protein